VLIRASPSPKKKSIVFTNIHQRKSKNKITLQEKPAAFHQNKSARAHRMPFKEAFNRKLSQVHLPH